MQTRPGSDEPDREPEEPADGSEGQERDPFTPKTRPGDEDEAESPESAEPEPEPEESDEPEEPASEGEAGEQDESGALEEREGSELAETVSLEDGAQAEPVPEAAQSEEDLAETVDMRSLLPEESAAEPEPSAEQDLAETMDLRSVSPEEPAGDGEPAESADAEGESGRPDKPGAQEAAETVNLRDLLPEAEGEEDQPPVRRRTPEGEPPRRRPTPGGQPPRRPAPGQHPHAGHASGEPGPRRRPPSEHAPDHAAKRHEAPAAAPRPAAAAAASVPAAPTKPNSVSLGRRRLLAAFWPPRLSRNQAVVGVLLAALGAAVAIQVHATNTSDEILRGARSDDLVNILDEVTSRGQSLDAELRNLETQNATIRDSADKAQAALTQAQQKAKDLQILSGTVKAKGSGITMTVTDPQGQLKSATLLNALEELRAAGAEVVQVDDVRVVVSSSFVDTPDGRIALDGHELAKPYVYKVIGDPNTLGPAMQIPGGVVATVKSSPGANVTITPGQVLVDAVAPQPNPDYAKAG